MQKFWDKVDKRGPDSCWNWLGMHNNEGYGLVGLMYRVYLAHRVSYTIAFGSIPDKLLVLHKCDNPRCVNPRHLYVGTHADNVRDRFIKTHPSKYLSREKIDNILEKYK